MESVCKDNLDNESTLHIFLYYLQQKSTYNTSIKPILFRLHKREITENIGKTLLCRELIDDTIGISLIKSYFEKCTHSDSEIVQSLETLEGTHSFATNFVVDVKDVLARDHSVLSEIISNDHLKS